MKSYFKENLDEFLKKNENNAYIDKEECEECQVVLDADLKGNEIVGIQKNDRVYYLGSRYDNEYFLEKWLESFEINSYKAGIWVFGLGDYRAIERLADKYPENIIVVYEPDLSYLKTIMEVYDLKNLIAKDNLHILAGDGGFKIFKDLNFINVDVTNYKNSIFKINTQYVTLYQDEVILWNGVIQDNVKVMFVDRNTYMQMGRERLENNLANYYDCTKSSNILDLGKMICDTKADTAILVSAGPSLDKNVELLKEVKNKAFIMAVDTAIKPVMNAGVKPDLTVTIDSHKPLQLFEYKGEFVDIPMIVNLQSNAKVIKKHKGKRFYAYNFDRTFFPVYGKEDYLQVTLNSGGSVANDAFSFLVRCGFKNIIFLGQDLAYSDKTHAGEAYNDEKRVQFVKKDRHFLIDDIYGNKVYTEENMNIYRRWFEKNIAENPLIHFVDATEGGAKIEGTEIMDFREAIDKYIAKLPEIKFEEMIKNSEELPDEVLQERMNRLFDITDEVKETKEHIKRAIKLYDELDDLNRKNKYGSSRFMKVFDEIQTLGEEIDNGIYVSFMSNIPDETEFDILEEIYDDKDSVYDEIKLVVDSGKKVLNKYLENYDEISGKIFDMVDEVKKLYS